MKKIVSLSILLLGFYCFIFSQSSITIQGESINDAYINSVNDWPHGHQYSLVAAQWTYSGGNEGYGRSLIKFDLTEIPEYSKIEYARLSLYHNPNSGHIGHSDIGGDNTGIIMRVVEGWTDEEVIWDTQPLTTNTNWSLLHPPDADDQDYPNLDVTQLIQDMVNHPDLQQGLMIKQLEESAFYRSLVFASIDHPNLDLWPELYVEYTEQTDIIDVFNIKPGPDKGKDAYINLTNYSPNGDEESLVASVWTHGGEPGKGRFLIDFHLPELSGEKELIRAELNLYHNPSSGHQGHTRLGGSNEIVIQRITEPWDENTVYWYNQPQTTSENEAYVNPSNLADQHYLNIDITNLMNDILANPDEGFGLFVKLIDESAMYRSVVFGSSDHSDSSLWPSLDIYYGSIITNDEPLPSKISCKVFPNPNSGRFIIELDQIIEEPIEIIAYDLYGRQIEKNIITDQLTIFDWKTKTKGIYTIQINAEKGVLIEKVVLE